MSRSNLVAVVFGASGETGREVVKELAKSPSFCKIIALVRRPLDMPDLVNRSKYSEVLTDYQDLDKVIPGIKHDVAICCIGTSLSKVSEEEFVRVELGLIVDCAQKSRDSGCQHFHLVSGFASHQESRFFIPRVKGQCEEALKKIGFQTLVIYRPGLLRCTRSESRPLEWLARSLSGLLDLGDWWSIQTSVLARAIVGQVESEEGSMKKGLDQTEKKILVLEHSDIVANAKRLAIA